MIINGSINIKGASRSIPEWYRGWKVWSLKNKWLTLHIAPQLGGRIIQVEFNGYPFFFVNPGLEGIEPGDNKPGAKGGWLNFGGEKIWPAPQGWDSPDRWPGPPDPVLDSGQYTVSEMQNDSPGRIRLTSLEDEFTGLQIVKDIVVSTGRPEVTINATFLNISDRPREWSVWPVFQMNTSNHAIGNQYSVTCPVNPASRFEKGYKEMHGLVNNPQNRLDKSGNLVVDYQYLVGKVGLDSTGNWVAYIDRLSGKVFVTAFEHVADASYPEGTSVQIWTQGRGLTYSRNKVNEYANDFEKNPPYLEIELLSPLYKLQPKHSASFRYHILVSTVPKNAEVCSVNETGVVAESLKAVFEMGQLRITGRFGVFCEGFLKLKIEDGGREHYLTVEEKVSPFAGIDIDFTKDVKIERPETAHISLDFFDKNGNFHGALNTTTLC